jgi:hypothetical protein
LGAGGALVAVLLAGCGGTSAPTTTSIVPPTSSSSTTIAETTTSAAVVTTLPEATTTTAPAVTAAIDIVGDEQFVAQAGAALELLVSEAPDVYAEVLLHISTVESVPAGSGMDVFTNTFRVGEVTAYAPGYEEADQVVWLAGTIVHDACHSRLYTDGEPYTGRDAELACLQDQLEALLVLSGFAFENYVQSLVDGVDDPENAYWTDANRHW